MCLWKLKTNTSLLDNFLTAFKPQIVFVINKPLAVIQSKREKKKKTHIHYLNFTISGQNI